MILFRPVGIEELRLIHASGMREFPPRLPEQPIFYPVLNEEYARQIAREWNCTSGSRTGFVMRFAIGDDFAAQYERRVVGSRIHEELWVPAEDLAELNRRIDGAIDVIAAYFGVGWGGLTAEPLERAGMLEELAARASDRGDLALRATLAEAAAQLRGCAPRRA